MESGGPCATRGSLIQRQKLYACKGPFTLSESKKDQRTSERDQKKKIQTSKKIFAFAFSRNKFLRIQVQIFS